jgi:RecJ-like exonuclease
MQHRKYIITVYDACQECHGDGHIIHPAWEQYHDAILQAPNVDRTLDPYDPETMERWFHNHGYDEIPDEEQTCYVCCGSGVIETASTLTDALKDLSLFQDLMNRVETLEQRIKEL